MAKKVSLYASLEREKAQQIKDEKIKKQKEEKEKKRQEKQTAKEKKKAEKAEKAKAGTGKRLAVSFLIAAVFFGVCVFVLKDMSEGEPTITLYVAGPALPANYQVSELSFFVEKEVPISLVPQEAVTTLTTLEGKFTACSISTNQIITSNLFIDKAANGTTYKNPIEVAVGTNSIADMVGGTIRKGDLVNISTVVSDGKGSTMTVPIIEKAYVTNTFTNNGAPVESEDATQPVTVINIIIDASVEADFNAALERGSLRISRIIQ